MAHRLRCAGHPVRRARPGNWDMPTPYPANNFHTENIQQFADEIAKGSGGKLTITVHPGGSLFKANEIKRAVQGGQAQVGELLISSLANEDPIYAIDTVPFLATSFADSTGWRPSRPRLKRGWRGTVWLTALLGAVAPQGLSTPRLR